MDEIREREAETMDSGKAPLRFRPWLSLVLAVGVAAAAFGTWWVITDHRVSADYAVVKAESVSVSGLVSGTVARVLVEDGQAVEAGQALVELDAADYRARLNAAEAGLAEIELEIQGAELALSAKETGTGARVAAAEAAHKAALQREREMRDRRVAAERREAAAEARARDKTVRYESLTSPRMELKMRPGVNRSGVWESGVEMWADEAPPSGGDPGLASVKREMARAVAELDAARSDLRGLEAEKGRIEALKAKRDGLRTELDAARLDLSRCVLTAPVSGYVTQTGLRVGDRVEPGRVLILVTPPHEVYVEAIFKGKSQDAIRAGQAAEVRSGLHPGIVLTGHVAGFLGTAAGDPGAVAPGEDLRGSANRTTRGIPVRINLDVPAPAVRPLRAGQSLEVTVDTAARRGDVLIRPIDPAPASTARSVP